MVAHLAIAICFVIVYLVINFSDAAFQRSFMQHS